RLRMGMLLLERVGTTPHLEIVRRADRWLEEHRGWDAERRTRARQQVQQLKQQLRQARDRLGPDLLVSRLRRDGVTAGYARVLATAPLDPLYIAPRTQAGFKALVAETEAYDLTGCFAELATIRVAHQQAGETV